MYCVMASQPGVEDPLTHTLSQTSSSSDSHTTVPVKCVSVTGILYVDKIQRGAGNVCNLKCILSESVWYSPIDF